MESNLLYIGAHLLYLNILTSLNLICTFVYDSECEGDITMLQNKTKKKHEFSGFITKFIV